MKFIVALLLTGILAFALGCFLDWWSIAIAAFIVALFIQQKPWLSFLSGFAALAILWGGLGMFINQQNGGMFASKIASILPLQGNVALLLIVTAFIGALVAGFAALTASYAQKK